MAQTGDFIAEQHRERQRAALYELLSSLGYDGAAEALYAAPGALMVPRSLADTRDGREEIIAQVQHEAFEDEQVGVIVIKDGKTLGEALRACGYSHSSPTMQGYA